MNKKLLSLLIISVLALTLCACGKKKAELDQDALNAALLGVDYSGEGVRILDSGVFENATIDTGSSVITLLSWQTGYGKTTTAFDIPAFFITMSIKNTSGDTSKIVDLCSPKIFVDGKSEMNYGGNIFAEKFEVGSTSITELRNEAEVNDYYTYVKIDPESPHSIEIEIAGQTFTVETK